MPLPGGDLIIAQHFGRDGNLGEVKYLGSTRRREGKRKGMGNLDGMASFSSAPRAHAPTFLACGIQCLHTGIVPWVLEAGRRYVSIRIAGPVDSSQAIGNSSIHALMGCFSARPAAAAAAAPPFTRCFYYSTTYLPVSPVFGRHARPHELCPSLRPFSQPLDVRPWMDGCMWSPARWDWLDFPEKRGYSGSCSCAHFRDGKVER